MNNGTDNQASPGADPLNAEERAMAALLARSAPRHEPSSTVDASILSAARAAATSTVINERKVTPAPRNSRQRWPMAIGAAATLVLAVGIAWQLRPQEAMQSTYSELPAAATAPARKVADEAPDETSRPAAMKGTGTIASKQESRAADTNDTSSAGTLVTPRLSAPKKTDTDVVPVDPARHAIPAEPEAEAPPVVFDVPAPVERRRTSDASATLAPPPPPSTPLPMPAAPPASVPPAASSQPAEAVGVAAGNAAASQRAIEQAAAVQRRQEQERVSKQAASMANPSLKPMPAPSPARSSAPASAPVPAGMLGQPTQPPIVFTDEADAWSESDDTVSDQPVDEMPPATVASPDVRQAWLQRIRELMAGGHLDDAQASLLEYRHRYPNADIPEDLLPLLDP